MREHWATYGRNYYSRHDYEEIDLDARQWPDGGAARGDQDACRARRFGALKVEAADDFAYHDPVDGSDADHQGMRMMFEGGSRIVYRLSGTGTDGATLRVYIERYEPPSGKLDQETQAALADLIALSRSSPRSRSGPGAKGRTSSRRGQDRGHRERAEARGSRFGSLGAAASVWSICLGFLGSRPFRRESPANQR